MSHKLNDRLTVRADVSQEPRGKQAHFLFVAVEQVSVRVQEREHKAPLDVVEDTRGEVFECGEVLGVEFARQMQITECQHRSEAHIRRQGLFGARVQHAEGIRLGDEQLAHGLCSKVELAQ